MGDITATPANNGIPGAIQMPQGSGATSIDENGIAKDIKGNPIGNVQQSSAPAEDPYAKYGGQPVAADPYAKYGGQPVQSSGDPYAKYGGEPVEDEQEEQKTEEPWYTKLGKRFKAAWEANNPTDVITKSPLANAVLPQEARDAADKAIPEFAKHPLQTASDKLGEHLTEAESENLSDIAHGEKPNELRTQKVEQLRMAKSALDGFIELSEPKNIALGAGLYGATIAGGAAVPVLAGIYFGEQALEPFVDEKSGLVEGIKKGNPDAIHQGLMNLSQLFLSATGVKAEFKEAIRTAAESERVAKVNLESANAQHLNRSHELETHVEQAKNATQAAVEAKQAEADGTGTRAQTIEAQNNASAAAAEAKKSQKAFAEATEAKNEANYKYEQAQADALRKTKQVQRSLDEKKTAANQQAMQDSMKSAPPAKSGPAYYNTEDWKNARPFEEQEHVENPTAGPKDRAKALQNISDKIDNQVGGLIEQYPDDTVTTNVMEDVHDALAQSPKTEKFVEDGLEHLKETWGIGDEPLTLPRAQAILTDLNAEMRGILSKSPAMSVETALRTDAKFAAEYHAADSIRRGIDGALTDRGVDGVRELRNVQRSVIRIKNAVEKVQDHGDQQVRRAGASGRKAEFGRAALKAGGAGVGAAIGGAIGAPLGIGGALGWGGAYAGKVIGEEIGKRYMPADLTRDALHQRSMEVTGAGNALRELQDTRPENARPGFAPPEAQDAFTQREMLQLQREGEDLHKRLLARYPDVSYTDPVDGSYAALEQRFLGDYERQTRNKVEPKAGDEELYNDINSQNMDDDKAVQEMQRQQAEKAADEKPLTATLPKNAEPVMKMRGRMQKGMDTVKGLVHDYAHAYFADMLFGNDLPSEGILSHEHPKAGKNLAVAAFDWDKFRDEKNPEFLDPAKFGPRIQDFATMYMAGGIANDMWHGVPIGENLHMGGDLYQLDRMMNAMKLTEEQQNQIRLIATQEVFNELSKPGIQEVMHDHASYREPGLSTDMHASKERVQQVVADLKGEEYEEGNVPPGRSGGNDAEVEQGAEGREGKGTTGQGEGQPKEAVGKANSGAAKGNEGGKAEGAEAGGRIKPENPNLQEAKAVEVAPEEAAEEKAKEREKERQAKFTEEKHPEAVGDEAEETLHMDVGGKKGTISYFDNPSDESGKKTLTVVGSQVAPELRNQGLGTRMYQELFDRARQKGYERVSSDTHVSPDAQRLWDSFVKKGTATKDANGMYHADLTKVKPENPALGEAPELTHRTTEKGGEVRLDSEKEGNRGLLKYTKNGDTAAVTAVNVDKSLRGQGLGQQMYERAADELRKQGVTHMTSDLGGQTSFDAGKVWDRLSEAHPGEIEKVPSKAGSPGYRWDLSKVKAENPALAEAPKGISTGNEDFDKMIRDAGGVPKGTLKGMPEVGLEHHALYDDKNKSTLATKFSQMTPENIKANLDRSHLAYAPENAVKTQAATGGFSFNPHDGSVPTDGYMVETHLDRGKDLGHVPTAEDIKQYMADNKDVLDANKNLHIGGWGNTLGISERIPDLDAALKAGKDRNQIAIYDLKNGKDIQTGGTGEVKIKPEEANPAFAQSDRVSTRVPTAKPKAGYTPEEHMGPEPLTVGMEAVKKDPRLTQKLADVVQKYPDFKIPKGIKDPAKILDRFVGQMKDNLLHVYDSVEPEKQKANAKWYESVNKKAINDAAEHGIEPRQAAGTYASLSPQKDWDMNADLARRTMDVHFNHADQVGTPKMKDFGQKLVDQARAGAEKNKAALEASGVTDPKIVKTKMQAYDRKMKNAADLENVVNRISSQKYSDIKDPYEKGVWVRLYDETNNPRNYPKIDPGTGNALDDVTTNSGAPAKVAWGSMEPIARAVSILMDGSRENISEQLGGEHKVRNFYNNIIDPTNNQDITADTHAVAAAHMQPFSGNSKEVANNFGGAGKSASTGVHGAYPLYAEAYRQAAAERGILPREMQSVTWEKIREMFPAEIKDADFQKQAKSIWKKYADGKASLEDTRTAIEDAAEERRSALKPAKAPQPKPEGITGNRINALDFIKALRDNKNAAGVTALGGQ